MRAEATTRKLALFMEAVGRHARGPGSVYLTGGATALLYGWREATVDIDIKADPEPGGLFESIALIKDELDVNVELASPDQFIPEVSGWRSRSVFIAQHGDVAFYHYDLYSQALAKLQRRHDRDLRDVAEMRTRGLIDCDRLKTAFDEIEPRLLRFPGIDAAEFRASVIGFCDADATHG